MRILTIILTIISLDCYGQKYLSGTYITSDKDVGFESDIFQFDKGGTFRYVLLHCTGTDLGRGEYTMTNNYLKLNFQNCDNCDKLKEIKTTTDFGKDSVEIDLVIKTFGGNEITSGVIGHITGTTWGSISDANGNLKIKIPKSENDRILRLQLIGFDYLDIDIEKTSSRIEGIVRLTNYWTYSSKDVKEFKIISLSESRMKLKRYPKSAMTYIKVDSLQTDKLIEDKMGEEGFKIFKERICTPANKVFK